MTQVKYIVEDYTNRKLSVSYNKEEIDPEHARTFDIMMRYNEHTLEQDSQLLKIEPSSYDYDYNSTF